MSLIDTITGRRRLPSILEVLNTAREELKVFIEQSQATKRDLLNQVVVIENELEEAEAVAEAIRIPRSK